GRLTRNLIYSTKPHIPIMEKIMRQRFNGNYPARKSIQTEFAHDGGAAGMLFQLDAIACR
ncbi:TPA: hypothetical protein ACP4ZI_005234, partial [Klebsiella pneumoniae]|nr:hypothetical protein [Klebsiella pneumoniae]